MTTLFLAAESVADVAKSVSDLGLSVDTVWMLLAAMLVFFMQPGFALCEAGFTRSKNTANILFKNFVDFMVGSVLFWFVGFGFMFGSDGAGFIGMPNFGDLSFYHGDLPTEGFLISRPCSVPLQPPSFLVPWQSAPSSPCTASIRSSSL